ncbi:Fe-S-containing hydro-lyase [Lutispora saccharofermentans]|uniref:Fe-S-containing hydro-lyase n=1 Tax=Lutispora saccharofermentans TaxID=3024236 RepID=A0ABT1NNL6_9FIRM|nr:Fe-S-containing hydro-lyase [Lutispora saccharofermentans]MCQ1531526.1 Fe-S-containing hydro-lyase [Lutispora saccharofermentans]
MTKFIYTPLTDDEIDGLKAGDRVMLSGIIYTARDAAHKRLVDMIDRGEELPLDLKGQVIYYVGPCPAKPDEVIGSAGPTTSGRMDAYTDALLERGLKGMIGKGERNWEVIDSMIRSRAVYFAAVGGAGALLAEAVKEAEVIAFPELGPEAVYRLKVENFPLTVAIDAKGTDIYKSGRKNYERQGR